FDEERRLRYELERTKSKLLTSAKDIAHLTEVSERNRIAREIQLAFGLYSIMIIQIKPTPC
ncbi:MAG: hypothetical protein M0Z35_12330, partial [Desulfitobacterium hafniense]|nr:hypothetical protein [Desulfitobacterium hafniense]